MVCASNSATPAFRLRTSRCVWRPTVGTATDECCLLRKVEPLREMLSGLRAWITGIRREQSPRARRRGLSSETRSLV